MFKCTCVNVEPGSYNNQMVVHAPAHMPKEDGYCLDRCIAEEVMTLWQLGITTTGCCCGHGRVPPYIGVADEDIPRMKEWGYIVKPNVNPGRENDEDSFTPMGRDYALAILLKSDAPEQVHDFNLIGANTTQRVFVHKCRVCGLKAIEHYDHKGFLEYDLEKKCEPIQYD